MFTRTGAGLTVAALAITMLTAGCSSDDEPAPNLSEQITDLTPEQRVEPATPPTDRDQDAVAAALWRLDACALVAPRPRGKTGVERLGPHSCELTTPDYDQLSIDVGRRLEPPDRFGLRPHDIGGALAYLSSGGDAGLDCSGWLPVSHDYAIAVQGEQQQCGRVRELLQRVVDRIDAPSSRRPVPGLGTRDACAVLRSGLGSAGDGRRFTYGAESRTSIDECAAVPRSTTVLNALRVVPTLEVESVRDRVLSFEEGATDITTPDSQAATGWPREFGSVRGRNVYGAGSKSDCYMRWAESTSILQLRTKSCVQARAIVRRITRRLDRPAPAPTAPQRPLLYEPTESDRAVRGACVDYMPLSVPRAYDGSGYRAAEPIPDCFGYAEPEVPDGAAERVVAAEANPNVTCALGQDVVHETFDDELRPATLGPVSTPGWPPDEDARDFTRPPHQTRPCVFTDPARRFQVQVYVSTAPMPISPDDMEHTRATPGTSDRQFGIGWIRGLGDKPDDPGYVAVYAGARAGVEEGLEARADFETKTEDAVADIVDGLQG